MQHSDGHQARNPLADESASLLLPDWPAPACVRAAVTTRLGGVSLAPYDSLNLGVHVGDDPGSVLRNRARLRESLQISSEPTWLKQVHGTVVARLPASPDSLEADAACAFSPGDVCAILTADCLPVLFCDEKGTVVAAAHAGWRGLLGGVLENTVQAMACPAARVMAWLGPAIGPLAFEVGSEVREAFVASDPAASQAFVDVRNASGKYLADIYLLARQRLQRCGVSHVFGGEHCTVSEPSRFYSYRRDGITGRMASLIWIEG